MPSDPRTLVFVGFNGRIAALDRDTGELAWDWSAPTPWGGGYVSLLLLDEQRLIASVNGYTYCLDPRTGEQLWYNGLSGFGTGVTSITALGMQSLHHVVLAAAADEANSSSQSTGTMS
jgi:outer membrane protein assembly factor BamB